MFTGIVEALGEISRIERADDSARIFIVSEELDLSDVKLGDSIAVSGPCLTVIDFANDSFTVDVSGETLARTTIGSKKLGSSVNLEKALRLSDRLGGHLVSGHVDGVGSRLARNVLEDYVQFRIEAPPDLAKYIAAKGSIALDGVSLTVNSIGPNNFDLMIIPHTLERTTMGSLQVGGLVNLEIDLVARYLERLFNQGDATESAGVSLSDLQQAGFGEK
jgi:riboflavin synthase